MLTKRNLLLVVSLLLGCFLFLYCWFFLIKNYNSTNAGGDFAEFANNAFRVLNGEKPYRDFWLLFPPGEVLFPAILYRIFGVNINVLLAAQAITTLLIGLIGFFFSRILFRNTTFALSISLLLILKGNINFYFLPQLISGLFLVLFLQKKKQRWLITAGIMAGIALSFRLYQSAPLIVASFISIWFLENEKGNKIRKMVVYSGSILTVIFLLLIYYHEIFDIAIKELFVQSVLHNASMSLPYFFSLKKDFNDVVLMWNWILREPATTSIYGLFFLIIKTGIHFLIYLLPFLILLLLFLFRKQWNHLDNTSKTICLFFFTWSILFLPYVLGRSAVERVMYVLPPFYFLMVFIMMKANPSSTFPFRKIISGILIFLVAGSMLTIYGGRSFLDMEKFPVKSQHGSIQLINADETSSLRKVIDYINEHSSENDFIFSTAWSAPPLYALTNHRNPAYYDSMIDLVARPSDEKQKRIIHDLQLRNTKLIILEPDLMFDNMPSRSYKNNCQLLDQFIQSNYILKEQFRRYQVYERK